MLHVRVVSPPGTTEGLVERLCADPGIRNLVVLPGAARQPDGDAVQFDLLTRFANPVLAGTAGPRGHRQLDRHRERGRGDHRAGRLG